MPDRKQDEPGEFKVVDRRLFTPDGQRRAGVEPEPPKPEPPPPPTPRAESAATQPKSGPSQAQPASDDHGPVRFDHLVMSLVTTAMLQMGLAARPGEPPPRPDLVAAQETIELLTMLQQKTKGNLTREEEEALSGSLAELRLAFVELSRRAGRGR